MEHLVEGHLGGYWIDDRHPELIQEYCEQCGDYDRVLLSWQKGHMMEAFKTMFSEYKFSTENIEWYYNNDTPKSEVIEIVLYSYEEDKYILSSLLENNSISLEESKELLKVIKESQKKQIDLVLDIYSKLNNKKNDVVLNTVKEIVKNDSKHIDDSNEAFKLKQREEDKEKMKTNTDYIEWLISFMNREKKFDDESWLYCEDELREEDKANVDKIDSFVDLIVEHADENNIPSVENDYGYSYNVKYKDTVLKISVLHGQGIVTDIELISNKEADDIINFENIIKENNKTKKLLLKPENKKQD